jgi:hypothetical protein
MEEEVVALFLYSRFLSGYRYLQSLAKIKDTEEGMADSMEFGKASSYYEALAIFALVLALIILRRVRGRSFPIWTSMMLGAALTIVFGIVPITKAYEAIDFDVIFFLLRDVQHRGWDGEVGPSCIPDVQNPFFSEKS